MHHLRLNIMMRDNYIDIHKIIKDENIFKLFRAVEAHGGVLRFVGGAVRDVLAGQEEGFDLDLATDLSPEELVEACEENHIKTVPIGIKFGTVGVLISDKVLEVTSLRRDVKTDGRHAEVEFTSDWAVDASRRDLTINAVYADEKGNVFDYYNGIEDLEKGNIRFIGNPNQRIKEDYLRILRFFRFYSIFGKGEPDKKALQACVENREGLKTLSIERIRDEIQKLLLTPHAAKTLKIMFENGILEYFMPESKTLDKLQFLADLSDKYKLPPCPVCRFFILGNPDEKLAEHIASRFKFSKKEKELFIKLAISDLKLWDFEQEENIRKLLYWHGREFCLNKLLALIALNKAEPGNLQQILKHIAEDDIPTFPLSGKHILAAGIDDNRKIGNILKNLEKIWVENGFNPAPEKLLEQAAEASVKAI